MRETYSLERNELLLAARIEQQQILKQLFIRAEAVIHAVFELKAKVLEELLILFAVIFEHGEQLGFDLLLQPGGDHLELAGHGWSISREMFRERSSESTRPLTKLK